jgi:pSer/pThr/pTyr-binding forkhead associated (FHA) protein
MRPLTAVEQFFERLFERPTARLFRTRLQPIQLQRRIERAMENERLSGAGRTIVPNRYRVYLHPDDLAAFGDLTSALAVELADGALNFARAHRYTLVDRPRVELVANRHLDRAEIRVDTRFAERPGDVDPGAPPDAALEASPPPELGAMTDTAIFTVARPPAPATHLRIIRSDGTEREVESDGSQMTIGRGRDNDLVLDDGKVSRHHARLMPRHGTLVFTDLGSTNGSWVNGTRVAEVALGEGDRIELGETVLVVESVAGSDD